MSDNTSDTGSRMIKEDVMMSGPSAQPRILFVTSEVDLMPEGTGNSTDYINPLTGGFGDLLAGLISDLLNMGADVYVAQPDYRKIFAGLFRYDTYIHDAENSKSSQELWTTFKAQREKELSMLLKELKNQIDSGMLALE